jgi:hypothetical protein
MTRLTYPAGPVTPHGVYHILKGDIPMVSLISPNDQIVMWLMGGQSTPDPTAPESVAIDRSREMTGLIPPWQTIDQQGATQDGVTFVDGLYEAMEVTLPVTVRGRDAKHTRRVQRHLFEALDLHQQSELGWMTHELGYWWAPVRWFKSPPDRYSGIATRQDWTLRLRADNAFWQSFPDIDSFGFVYEDMSDDFDVDYSGPLTLGPNWPQRYDGDGGGFHYSKYGLALWLDDPGAIFFTRSREVVNGPYKDFSTVSDNQVVTIELGAFPEWSWPESGSNDIWARMGRLVDGSWDGNGIRARLTLGGVWLSCFKGYDEVWSRLIQGFIWPGIGDQWSLVAGYQDDPRLFKVLRNGAPVLQYKEPTNDPAATSHVGPAYRGVGFGVRAAGALLTQATPAAVRKISTGDNTTRTQSGFLKRHNAGDQKAYDEYTLYGPGTAFKIANGPGSSDLIEFGPLSIGEIAHIRTDPRNKAVFNYTAGANEEVAPALFGASPSDTMARRMKGRFTSDCYIPPKEAGMRVEEHLVACSITGGNADSRILGQLTPLRRFPE